MRKNPKLRLAMASMGKHETNISDLCKELGITRQTLYRHIAPDGSLRVDGVKLLKKTLTGFIFRILCLPLLRRNNWLFLNV
jgi:DNA-binding phage protein